jgi:hypothetical protein
MSNILSLAQLQQQQLLLSNGGIKAVASFYSYMSAQGYGYANLSGGLVTCPTLPGNVALNFMTAVAAENGVALTQSQVANIELQMAEGYISALISNASKKGSTSSDISYQQALGVSFSHFLSERAAGKCLDLVRPSVRPGDFLYGNGLLSNNQQKPGDKQPRLCRINGCNGSSEQPAFR